MGDSNIIFYIPPILFGIVALAFFLLWHLKVTPGWHWGAGFAQTSAGFVVSTFLPEQFLAAFASGVIFIGAAYCYGSGLLRHFRGPILREQRLAFVALYTAALAYTVYWQQSLVAQLFLTDVGFAFLLGWAVWVVARNASRPIDIALVVTSCVVVLDSVVRAVFFTFFTKSSNNFGDFASSLYNLEVTITTITICMFFPFTALAASATAAIERHRTAAGRDELTGLLNRRGFWDAVQLDPNGAVLTGSLIVCDIDHFKHVNDTYGHAVGDLVIQRLARELEHVIGELGYVARFGGEEFVAFLPNSSIGQTVALAETVRSCFAVEDWAIIGVGHAVTVSCGVCAIIRGEMSLDDAIDRADGALYLAKNSGRNRVVATDVEAGAVTSSLSANTTRHSAESMSMV